MAYKVIILYQLYMPSYFLGTFTEYPYFIFAFVRYIGNFPFVSEKTHSFAGLSGFFVRFVFCIWNPFIGQLTL